MQREQLGTVQVGRHPAQLGLRQLKGRDRLAELLTGTRVLNRALQAVPGRSSHPPGDAEPGFRQAGQRTFESGDAGQYGVGGQPDLVQVQL